MTGALYVVATPIGNLGDLSPRAREVLAAVDFIAAEDTRVARRLLTHFGIDRPAVSYHAHSSESRETQILARMRAGESCALTTDAGTPAVSDPGGELVAACRAEGIPVYAVPGPCAAVAAFSISGLAATRFCFEGFLSVNRQSRKKHLESLREENRPMVFYEAPHKLRATLADFCQSFGGERPVFIARELTKLHEECFSGSLSEAEAHFTQNTPRGEFVLIVSGRSAAEYEAQAAEDEENRLARALALAREHVENGLRPSEAARQAALTLGLPKNAVYRALLNGENDTSEA